MSSNPLSTSAFDAIIVGGGHNGLAAAAYLAKAGRHVLVLEQLEHPGGAAISAHAFDGVDARLSRYSYLVSLLPRRIIEDLGLRIELARRRYSSYTPDPQDSSRALLVDNGDEAATAASFAAVGAPDGEFQAFTRFYAACRQLTEALWPTMTAPLLPRSEARALAARAGAAEAWEAMIEHPIGNAITKELGSDLVRGVVLTDALIGTFARADDEDLQQNICFLYHLIGGGTGDWDVPVGGMGAVSGELERAARDAGATILTSAEVTAVRGGGGVDYRHGGRDHSASAPWVLSNVAPAVLDRLRDSGTVTGHGKPEPSPRGRAGQGQPPAQAASPAPGRVRQPGGGLWRDLPHQRDLDSTRLRLPQCRRRIGALAAAVRNLLPLSDGPQHPVRGAAGRGRPDAHGIRSARS